MRQISLFFSAQNLARLGKLTAVIQGSPVPPPPPRGVPPPGQILALVIGDDVFSSVTVILDAVVSTSLS